MTSYLFILGRKTELCAAELFSVLAARFPEAYPVRLHDSVVLAVLPDEATARGLQSVLGGTMKVVEVAVSMANMGTPALEKKTADVLAGLLSPEMRKITFGIGEFGRESLDALSQSEIKKHLKEMGISSRFIDGVRSGLSASVLLHQDVEEVLVVKNQDTVHIGFTIAVQNIDDWTKRDREKPAADRKRGMLPPKLARIMVNLAVPGREKKRILDPFCGTGTVLLEGLMLGHEVIGSDIRRDAIMQTKDNFAWFVSQYPDEYTFDAFMADATQVTPELLNGKVDAIVAEGLLGPVTPGVKELPNIFKGLEKLYTGSLRHWTKILKPGSHLCLALPLVLSGNKTYSLEKLIDDARSLGYNTLLPAMVYDRPEAVVKRQIFVLEYDRENT